MIGATASVWGSTLAAVFAVSLISLVGILALVAREALLRRLLPLLVSFAVGALLGDALFHILPLASAACKSTCSTPTASTR